MSTSYLKRVTEIVILTVVLSISAIASDKDNSSNEQDCSSFQKENEEQEKDSLLPPAEDSDIGG